MNDQDRSTGDRARPVLKLLCAAGVDGVMGLWGLAIISGSHSRRLIDFVGSSLMACGFGMVSGTIGALLWHSASCGRWRKEGVAFGIGAMSVVAATILLAIYVAFFVRLN